MRLDRPVDLKFTRTYAQPPEYRFCQDSVILPHYVAGLLAAREIGREFRTLDACAGCGVIGLELAFHDPRLQQIDFLEIQPLFRDVFAQNAGAPPGYRFIEASFTALTESAYASTYDLIVSNPPYFWPGEGRLSPNDAQNRCRFFLDASPRTLIEGFINALKPGGEAFVLMKSGEQHGRSLQRDLQAWLAGRASVELPASIRGTEIVHLRKPAMPNSPTT